MNKLTYPAAGKRFELLLQRLRVTLLFKVVVVTEFDQWLDKEKKSA